MNRESPSFSCGERQETRKFTKRAFRYMTRLHSVEEAHTFLYNEFLRERKAAHELVEIPDKLHDSDN